MAEPLDPSKADKRTWERYARMGLLDEKAYEKHVKGLPDIAEKGESIRTTVAEEQFAQDDDDADTFSEDIPEV